MDTFLHEVEHDFGGMTYAGIARNFNPGWEGWVHIDENNEQKAKELVRGFYLENYWNACSLSSIEDLDKQETIYDAAVNMGVKVASKLVQICCGSKVDGVIGTKNS